MNKVSEFLSNWIRSPTGPKTTHFWAPLMNWFFPIQALYDWNRNPENISRGMQGVLVGYSTLFMRWSVRITPKNFINFGMHATNFCLQGRLLAKRVMWEIENPEKAEAQREVVRQRKRGLLNKSESQVQISK